VPQTNNLLMYGIKDICYGNLRETRHEQSFKYANQEIPIVREYIYLGIKFNDSLDLNKMAKFRICHGWLTLEKIAPILKNKCIPYEYKIILIKGVLIPRLTYGLQIVGLRLYCMEGLRKIINKALGLMIGMKKFCRSRAYEEFGLCSIEQIAHYYMMKSFKCWENSKSIARNLIKSTEFCLKEYHGK
jgi:hypothetical protein